MSTTTMDRYRVAVVYGPRGFGEYNCGPSVFWQVREYGGERVKIHAIFSGHRAEEQARGLADDMNVRDRARTRPRRWE